MVPAADHEGPPPEIQYAERILFLGDGDESAHCQVSLDNGEVAEFVPESGRRVRIVLDRRLRLTLDDCRALRLALDAVMVRIDPECW